MSGPVFLVVPDAFKGCLPAAEVAAHLAAGLLDVLPAATVRTQPLADGGEGTLAVLAAAGAQLRRATVSGPLGDPIEASWALWGGTGYVEAAQAAGHGLVARSHRTALEASTFGVGELIATALGIGVDRLVVTAGGTASTDGGAGMLQALGAAVLSAQGQPVARGGQGLLEVGSVRLAPVRTRLAGTPVTLAYDVTAPLLGPGGAAAAFAPQKGAGPVEVGLLEEGLRRWADAVAVHDPASRDLAARPGAGAGGGLGYGCLAGLGATGVPGAELVMDAVGLDLAGVDLVVTGEGRFDEGSLAGKVPLAVLRRGTATRVPVALVAGQVALDAVAVGFARGWNLTGLVGGDAGRSQDGAAWLLRERGRQVARWWSAGAG